MEVDVFISYATEDEEDVVIPLAAELRRRGFSVWYSGMELRFGQQVAGSIDPALGNCKFLVAVLSPRIFGKPWPEREIRTTLNRGMGSGKDIILPVWHGVGLLEVQRHFPLLADTRGIDTSIGLARVATELAAVMRPQLDPPKQGLVMNVSVAIVARGSEFLVIRRRQKEGELSWAFPAGRVKATEDAKNAAERETKEETGITCRAVRSFGERVHPTTGTALSYWLCEYVSGTAELLDAEELAEVRWASGPEALALFTSDVYAPVKAFLLGGAVT